MNKYEIQIEAEEKRHHAALTAITDELEQDIVNRLKTCGNFMMLPDTASIRVHIIDSFDRDIVNHVYAVGNTKDGHIIYVTGEALYQEYRDETDVACDENGTFKEQYVKDSDYWWSFDDNVYKPNILVNKINVLTEVLNIIEADSAT